MKQVHPLHRIRDILSWTILKQRQLQGLFGDFQRSSGSFTTSTWAVTTFRLRFLRIFRFWMIFEGFMRSVRFPTVFERLSENLHHALRQIFGISSDLWKSSGLSLGFLTFYVKIFEIFKISQNFWDSGRLFANFTIFMKCTKGIFGWICTLVSVHWKFLIFFCTLSSMSEVMIEIAQEFPKWIRNRFKKILVLKSKHISYTYKE